MYWAKSSADMPRTSTRSIDTKTSPARTCPLTSAGPSTASDATTKPSPCCPACGVIFGKKGKKMSRSAPLPLLHSSSPPALLYPSSTPPRLLDSFTTPRLLYPSSTPPLLLNSSTPPRLLLDSSTPPQLFYPSSTPPRLLYPSTPPPLLHWIQHASGGCTRVHNRSGQTCGHHGRPARGGEVGRTPPGRRCRLRPGFGDQVRRWALLMPSRLLSEGDATRSKGGGGGVYPPARPTAQKSQRRGGHCTALHRDSRHEKKDSLPLPRAVSELIRNSIVPMPMATRGSLKHFRTGWYATAHRRLHRRGLPHGGLSSAAAVHCELLASASHSTKKLPRTTLLTSRDNSRA